MTRPEATAMASRWEVLDLAAGRAAAESEVTAWRWSRGLSDWDRVEPFGPERDGQRRGRLRVKRPTGKFLDHDLVGLDAEGRPVLVRAHDGIGEPSRETHLHWSDRRVEIVDWGLSRWDGPGPTRLTWLEVTAEGRPARLVRYSQGGGIGPTESYEHDDDGRVVKAAIHTPARDDVPAWDVEYLGTYDGAGELIAVDCAWKWPPPGGRKRVWRTPPDRTAIRAWKDTVIEQLPVAILESLGMLDHPTAVVALVYDDESVLTSALAMPADELPTHIEACYDGQLLSPPDWDQPLDLDLQLDTRPELQTALEQLTLELVATPGLARDLLNEVAQRLNTTPWPGNPPNRQLACACDVTGEHADANAKKALGPDRYRQLRQAKWL